MNPLGETKSRVKGKGRRREGGEEAKGRGGGCWKERKGEILCLHLKYLVPLWLPSCLPLVGSSHSTPSQTPEVPETSPT